MPPLAQLTIVMHVIAGLAAGWYAWRKRRRDDIAVAVFMLAFIAIELMRWGVYGAAPRSVGWYVNVGLLLGELVTPAALALYVLARRSPWPASALLVIALAALAYDARSVTWLYRATDATAAVVGMLCVIPFWRRDERPSFGSLIAMLVMFVSCWGAVVGGSSVSESGAWPAHLAAEVCIAMLASVYYLKGSIGNGKAPQS